MKRLAPIRQTVVCVTNIPDLSSVSNSLLLSLRYPLFDELLFVSLFISPASVVCIVYSLKEHDSEYLSYYPKVYNNCSAEPYHRFRGFHHTIDLTIKVQSFSISPNKPVCLRKAMFSNALLKAIDDDDDDLCISLIYPYLS